MVPMNPFSFATLARTCVGVSTALRRSPRWLIAAIAGLVVAAELLHQRAGQSAIAPDEGSAVVVVLGYPTLRSGRPHPIQRWRVRLGVRTMRATGASHIIFSGGSPRNAHTEAETMARLAVAADVPDAAIIVETESVSTWQNVAYCEPLTRGFDHVILASDPLHAKRAHRYWIEQHPDDRERIYVSDARLPFEGAWSSVPTAAVEIIRSIRKRLGGG